VWVRSREERKIALLLGDVPVMVMTNDVPVLEPDGRLSSREKTKLFLANSSCGLLLSLPSIIWGWGLWADAVLFQSFFIFVFVFNFFSASKLSQNLGQGSRR